MNDTFYLVTLEMSKVPWEKECIAHVTGSMRTNPSPGPGYYDVKRKFKKQCPPVYMKGRHSQSYETNPAPYYNVPSNFGKVTRIGLHGRTDLRDKFMTPGPSYVPPSFGSNARKIGIAAPTSNNPKRVPKGKEGAQSALSLRHSADCTPGPGPAAYSIRDKSFDAEGTTGVIIKGHHDFKYDVSVSPGPGAYAPKFKAVLPSAPQISFHDRPKDKEPESQPGYRNLGSTLTGPSFTMKARASDDIHVV